MYLTHWLCRSCGGGCGRMSHSHHHSNRFSFSVCMPIPNVPLLVSAASYILMWPEVTNEKQRRWTGCCLLSLHKLWSMLALVIRLNSTDHFLVKHTLVSLWRAQAASIIGTISCSGCKRKVYSWLVSVLCRSHWRWSVSIQTGRQKNSANMCPFIPLHSGPAVRTLNSTALNMATLCKGQLFCRFAIEFRLSALPSVCVVLCSVNFNLSRMSRWRLSLRWRIFWLQWPILVIGFAVLAHQRPTVSSTTPEFWWWGLDRPALYSVWLMAPRAQLSLTCLETLPKKAAGVSFVLESAFWNDNQFFQVKSSKAKSVTASTKGDRWNALSLFLFFSCKQNHVFFHNDAQLIPFDIKIANLFGERYDFQKFSQVQCWPMLNIQCNHKRS